MENTEFTAQLAQFSQLESMAEMNSNIELMAQFQNSMNSMQAASFIGRRTPGATPSTTRAGAGIDFNLEGNASLDSGRAVYNSSGTTVRTITMNSVQEGDVTCTWDGMNDSSEAVNPGRTITASRHRITAGPR